MVKIDEETREKLSDENEAECKPGTTKSSLGPLSFPMKPENSNTKIESFFVSP